MTKIVSYNSTVDSININPKVSANIVRGMFMSLNSNNTYMPAINRIIYNVGKKAYPKHDANGHKIKENGKIVMSEPMDVLSTVVFFVDGTKVVVTNNEHDGIELETKTVADGITVKVASERSKEIGLMYALVKRLMGLPDENGTIKPHGFINAIQKFVRNAYDTKLESAKKAYNDKLAKEAAKQKAAEPKAKNPSLAQVVNDLNDATKNLLSVTKDLLNK